MRSRRERVTSGWRISESSRNRCRGIELRGIECHAAGYCRGLGPGNSWRRLAHSIRLIRNSNSLFGRDNRLLNHDRRWLNLEVPLAVRALYIGNTFVNARFRLGLRLGSERDDRFLALRFHNRSGWRRGRRRRSGWRRSYERLRCARLGLRLILARCATAVHRPRSHTRCDGQRLIAGGTLTRTASAETQEAEALLLLLRYRDAGKGAGHLPNDARNGRIFKHQRSAGVLHLPHCGKIVGDLPLGRPGQGLRYVVVADSLAAGIVAVDHDFELGAAGAEELADQAIRVAQLGDSRLGDQIDRLSLFEERRTRKIEPRSHIDHHAVVILTRNRQQPVDRLVGGRVLRQLARRREHIQPGIVLDQELGEKARVQPPGFLKSIDGRVFRNQPKVERRVSQRKVEIDQEGALRRILGQGNCKIAGQSGDAGAALGSEKHQQFAACLFRTIGRTTSRGANHGLGHGIWGEGQSEKLASSGPHAAHEKVRVGLG